MYAKKFTQFVSADFVRKMKALCLDAIYINIC